MAIPEALALLNRARITLHALEGSREELVVEICIPRPGVIVHQEIRVIGPSAEEVEGVCRDLDPLARAHAGHLIARGPWKTPVRDHLFLQAAIGLGLCEFQPVVASNLADLMHLGQIWDACTALVNRLIREVTGPVDAAPASPFGPLPRDLITQKEAARLLRVRSETVRRWRKEKKLPGYAGARLSRREVLEVINACQRSCE